MSYRIVSRIRQLVDGGEYHKGLRLLLTHNSNQPERCRGRLTEYSGVPALEYCNRWTCWLHGPDRLWREGRRALLGALWVKSQGLPLYWIRLSLVDPAGDGPAAFKGLRMNWSKAAKAAGVDLHYYGLGLPKPSDGVWHAHLIASWLPDPEPDPTPTMRFRLRDQDFNRWAHQAGLRSHVEVAGSVDAVVGYLVKNGREAVRSKVWPDVLRSDSWVHQKPISKDPLVRDALDQLHGSIYAGTPDGDLLQDGNGSPVNIPKSLVLGWLAKGRDVVVLGAWYRSTCSYREILVNCGSGKPGDQVDPEPGLRPLWWWVLPRLSEFRRCTKCHQVLPWWEFHLSGKRGRRPDCRCCVGEYNRTRRPGPRSTSSGSPGGRLL